MPPVRASFLARLTVFPSILTVFSSIPVCSASRLHPSPIRMLKLPKLLSRVRLFSTPKTDKSSLQLHKIVIPEFVEREAQKANLTKRELIKFLWPYIFPKDPKLRFILASSLGILVLAKSIQAGIPLIMKEGVNELASAHPNFLYAGEIFLAFAVAKTGVVALQEFRNVLFNKVLQNAVKDVSGKLFWHLHAMDYTFHLQSTKSTLFAVGRAVHGVENFLKLSVGTVLPTIVEISLVSGVLLGCCGWQYLSVLGATMAIYSTYSYNYSFTRQTYLKESRRKSKAVDFVINESFTNFDTVKAFTNEQLESDRYTHYLTQQLAAAQLTQVSLSKLNTGQQLIFNAGFGLNLLLGVWHMSNGLLSVGDLVMIQTLFLQLQGPLNFLSQVYRQLNESQLDMKDLFVLLAKKPKVADKPGAKAYVPKGGEIAFNNVEYSHFANQRVINDLTFTLKKGSTNAIVGESGAGKSTIFRLILRLLDPEKGKILIDGEDIRDLTIDSVRRSISIVPQTSILFNGTVLYNLLYGKPNATFEEVQEICKLVNLHDLIQSLPDGYYSHVGEMGSKFSGGERQRLMLARGLLKPAEIYLFDEVTSAVDSLNEEIISRLIKSRCRGKTLLYSAHRLSSITHVDQILVVEKGKVIQSGTHEALVREGTGK